MMSCIHCETPTNKYKCPTCLGPYCSLGCYKEHKKQECVRNSAVDSAAARELDENDDQEPTLHDPFRTEDTVPREKLEQLRNCEGLRNQLYNPHLRNLLREIDVAPNAWKAMRAAMQEPLFVEFADECLQVIEPPSAEEQRETALLH